MKTLLKITLILILLISCKSKPEYKYRVGLHQPNDSFVFYYTNNIVKDTIDINCINFKIEKIDSATFVKYFGMNNYMYAIKDTNLYDNLCTEYIVEELK